MGTVEAAEITAITMMAIRVISESHHCRRMIVMEQPRGTVRERQRILMIRIPISQTLMMGMIKRMEKKTQEAKMEMVRAVKTWMTKAITPTMVQRTLTPTQKI